MKSFILLILLMLSVSVSPQEETKTEYTELEISMSQLFSLTPAEIRKWERIKQTQQFRGLVESDLSVYETLALTTDNEQELRRLAILLAKMNTQLVKKLIRFDELYQEEISKLEPSP